MRGHVRVGDIDACSSDKRAGHGQCGQMCFRILCLKQVSLWSLAGRPSGTCNGINRPGRPRCITCPSGRLSASALTPRSATSEHAAIESIHQLPSRTSFLEWAVDNARASSQRPFVRRFSLLRLAVCSALRSRVWGSISMPASSFLCEASRAWRLRTPSSLWHTLTNTEHLPKYLCW